MIKNDTSFVAIDDALFDSCMNLEFIRHLICNYDTIYLFAKKYGISVYRFLLFLKMFNHVDNDFINYVICKHFLGTCNDNVGILGPVDYTILFVFDCLDLEYFNNVETFMDMIGKILVTLYYHFKNYRNDDVYTYFVDDEGDLCRKQSMDHCYEIMYRLMFERVMCIVGINGYVDVGNVIDDFAKKYSPKFVFGKRLCSVSNDNYIIKHMSEFNNCMNIQIPPLLYDIVWIFN